MLNLREYRKRPASLADWLPWAGLVAPGVVLNKDGAFQRTARFRGPDLDSATESELIATTARLNNALKRLGSGWALFVEAERLPAAPYPLTRFPDPLSWLVDRERRAGFDESGDLFESAYHLTFLFMPPEEAKSHAGSFLYDTVGPRGIDWRGQLARYIDLTERLAGLFEGVLPEFAWLDDAATLTFLHGTVSTKRHPVAVPDVPIHLDALLADEALTSGLAPMLGAAHLRTLTIRGFPTSTWPGVLDDLNRLAFPYRWVARFLCLDKSDAEKELGKLRRQWFAKRKGILVLLRETVFQQESPLVDSDANNKAIDADEALQALGSDAIGFGYVTATVSVWDDDIRVADERLRTVERTIQSRGFVATPETLNAVEAWLSSIPGQVYANVRQPIISTLNLAHLMPISAVWAGPDRNAHLDGPPLLVTRTDGATPFRLNLHVGDVGHTVVVGPTGAGKSVLLATLVLQFRKYADAQIQCLLRAKAARSAPAFLASAATFMIWALEGGLSFQPLRNIDDPAERAWASEWVQGLLLREGVDLTPDTKDMVWAALNSLASAPQGERTLTGFSVVLQSAPLRQALTPYTVAGPFGRLLDADEDRPPSHPAAGLRDGGPDALTGTDGGGARLSVPSPGGRLRWPPSHVGARRGLGISRRSAVRGSYSGVAEDPAQEERGRGFFATQSLARTIQRSSIAPAIIEESCPSRIFLPSPQATEPQLRSIYEEFRSQQPPDRHHREGHAQARLLPAVPARQPPVRARSGSLVALAFAGASTPADHTAMDQILAAGGEGFAAQWLRRRDLGWAADLIADRTASHSEEPHQ